MGEFSDRRTQTQDRIKTLKEKLAKSSELAKGKACIYATGSFGRCEASKYSDLDIFIVTKVNSKKGSPDFKKRLLKRLDEICIKAELIDVTKTLKISEFSGDGRYLVSYSVAELTDTLGKPEDDALNTFTARLLLLLESTPLIEDDVYRDVIKEVVASYWKDFDGHENNFVPAFLTNDILRLWRTLCVNYEANTSTAPARENAKRKSKNFKLKHSRLLTCYSAILYLLAIYQAKKTVTQEDVIEMTQKTPVGRLNWLLDQRISPKAKDAIKKLIAGYERFLVITNVPERDLTSLFMDRDIARRHMARANQFGDLVFNVLTTLGDGRGLHRLVVV